MRLTLLDVACIASVVATTIATTAALTAATTVTTTCIGGATGVGRRLAGALGVVVVVLSRSSSDQTIHARIGVVEGILGGAETEVGELAVLGIIRAMMVSGCRLGEESRSTYSLRGA